MLAEIIAVKNIKNNNKYMCIFKKVYTYICSRAQFRMYTVEVHSIFTRFIFTLSKKRYIKK